MVSDRTHARHSTNIHSLAEIINQHRKNDFLIKLIMRHSTKTLHAFKSILLIFICGKYCITLDKLYGFLHNIQICTYISI